MFCFQCEQTEKGTGCTTIGVCGKTPEVSGLQDLLVESCKGISAYANRAYALGAPNDRKLDDWVLGALFSTVTNVNFDADRFSQEFLKDADVMLGQAKKMYVDACKKAGKTPEDLDVVKSETLKIEDHLGSPQLLDVVHQHAGPYGVLAQKEHLNNENSHSIHQLITYGLKGAAAYAHHAGFVWTIYIF
jgi:hydroxylamine reductase